MAGSEVGKEVLWFGAEAGNELVAFVAELGEKLAGGVLEREGLEMGEGGFHGRSSRVQSSASFRVSSSSRSNTK